MHLVAILSLGRIKTDFMEAWRRIQRGSSTERKMYNDPRCHRRDFWTALVSHTVLQRRGRELRALSCIINVIPYGNVARAHTAENRKSVLHMKKNALPFMR